ncbi:MAG TPA: hypothetical protein RMF84_05635 [Polyangiaceae bacterium LLY-WYZ-14_1]|jgi:hypothetical protein|nr:hypothetical protein [Polyangiaceae bacterium LLY-WYZ-14_1]
MASLNGLPADPGAIQRWLVRFYGLPEQAPVDPFLCSRAEATVLLGAPPHREEMLLVASGDDGEGVPATGVQVSLYLDPALLDRLAERPSLRDQWLVVEGVSHFAYLAFRAERGEPVTELELELQAEVDKYAIALVSSAIDPLEGQGVGVIRASQRLRERLFENVRFLDDADSEEGDRYRRAHRLAARFVQRLERRRLSRRDLPGFQEGLRRFYRARQPGKLAAAGG